MTYQEVEKDKDNIQIIYCRKRRHWICVFYDCRLQKIFIYDSNCSNQVELEIMCAIYSLYRFLKQNADDFIYKKVVQQKYDFSGGIFASSFATMLAY